MIAHIAKELTNLASTCEIIESEPVQGWSIDTWELSEISMQALRNTYQALISPSSFTEVLQILAADGIDQTSIFFDDSGGSKENLERIKRADMLELAAASSMLANEDILLDTLVMPNVPKGSRKQSAPGIDVMSVRVNKTGPVDQLDEDELLYIGSVKHTLSDCAGLRLDLDRSVSEKALTVPYLGVQLRVLQGRLEEQGLNVARILLVLRSTPLLSSKHIRIVAVGAVDCDDRASIVAQFERLSDSEPGLRRLRCLLVPNLAELHL